MKSDLTKHNLFLNDNFYSLLFFYLVNYCSSFETIVCSRSEKLPMSNIKISYEIETTINIKRTFAKNTYKYISTIEH